jgi:heterodisulfide reductase subunit C2
MISPEEQEKDGGRLADPLEPVRKMLSACIQCGTCSASCPSAAAMDLTPRRLWRHVLLGDREAVFGSHTFTLCSACYYCTLRCPRGLPLTDAMAALKRIAAREEVKKHRTSIRFYGSFLDSIRRHGRVHETEFMTLFFLGMKDPLLPLKFAPLGFRLAAKGKLALALPSREPNDVAPLFERIEKLEARP